MGTLRVMYIRIHYNTVSRYRGSSKVVPSAPEWPQLELRRLSGLNATLDAALVVPTVDLEVACDDQEGKGE